MMQRVIMVFFSLSMLIFNADAKSTKNTKKLAQIPAPTQASLVVDANTGRILHADKADHKIYPASTIKMMTLYLAFDAIDRGQLSLSTMITASKNVLKTKPGKIWINPGEKISVRDAIIATSVKSANDSALVLAEAIAGTEENFAKLMNKKAKELKMFNTHFTNSHGWHHPHQHSTATDLAKLVLALQDKHAKYTPLLRKTTFQYKGQTIHTHDKVLAHYPGAVNGKTGFHCPGGFNIVTLAERNGKKLAAVVTGGTTPQSRNKKITALLDTHFGVEPQPAQKYSKVKLASNVKHKKGKKKYRT